MDDWPGVDLTDPRITRVVDGFAVQTSAGTVTVRATGMIPYLWRVYGPDSAFRSAHATAGDAIEEILPSKS